MKIVNNYVKSKIFVVVSHTLQWSSSVGLKFFIYKSSSTMVFYTQNIYIFSCEIKIVRATIVSSLFPYVSSRLIYKISLFVLNFVLLFSCWLHKPEKMKKHNKKRIYSTGTICKDVYNSKQSHQSRQLFRNDILTTY